MEYRRLGSAGLKVSAISIGSWATFGDNVDEAVSRAVLHTALDGGVNFIDNAEVYENGKSTSVIGKFTQGMRRESLVLSTKVFWGGEGPNDSGLSRKHIVEGFHQELKRLQTDYVDLLFCHRPDPNTPIEETVWTMDNLIRQGKVLYWGTSEWSAQELTAAYAIAKQHHLLAPQMEQPEYNLLHRERVEKEYAPLYALMGLGTTVWSPLAAGVLTGKYNNGGAKTRTGFDEKWFTEMRLKPDSLSKVAQLMPLASDLGCSMAALALAWCLKNPNVSTAITGATKPAQMAENLKAFEVLPKLTPEVMAKIETIVG